MTHITLGTKQEYSGMHIVLAAAPREVGPATAGR